MNMQKHLTSVITAIAYGLTTLALLTYYHRYHNTAQSTLARFPEPDINLQQEQAKQFNINEQTARTTSSNADPLIVHYIFLQEKPSDISFLDCMGVVSVMKNLQPDFIYFHTNYPDHFPFDNCLKYHEKWTTIKIIPIHRRFMINGKRIEFIHHEADILRLENLQKYGGLALDFDVIVINGQKLRDLLRDHTCIICDEPKFPELLNSGFMGCHVGARFPGLMLDVYHTDYRPNSWLFNSGTMAFRVWSAESTAVHVVPGVCNYPGGPERDSYFDQRGHYNWTTGEKVALHTFIHDRKFGEQDAMTKESSFVPKSMMKGQEKELAGGLLTFDFTPQCLAPDSTFSWPEFAKFSTLIGPANDFLQQNPGLAVKSCETAHFRVDGDSIRKPEKSDFKQVGESLRPFVKGLRLFATRRNNQSINQPPDQLGYTTFHLEVDPKLPNTLSHLTEKVNDYLKRTPLPGKLVAVESLQFRGVSPGFDTDTTCWKPDTSFFLSQQEFLTVFRIWFTLGRPQCETIGFADFFPAVLDAGGWLSKATVEELPSVMANVNRFINALPSNIEILNVNTLASRTNKSAEYHLAHYTFTEDDKFHKYYIKFIRIAYVVQPQAAAPPAYEQRHFTTELFAPGLLEEPGFFSSGVFEPQSVVRARMDDWVRHTQANVVAVETVVYKSKTGGEGRNGFGAMYTWNEEHYNSSTKRTEPSNEQYLICYRVFLEGAVRHPPGYERPRGIEEYRRENAGDCSVS
ncbi:hypothetical protein BV898_15543 [Hypsibius exemplaris]|uniref:Uncharacterized protein n=1 Tax=Hypsibius exemplaris TaxID=2072580 RepID=A0A9X6NHZ9_HYPEX|nr:hypothetical protein BV898_15543 [Hypsibius exemplaris]